MAIPSSESDGDTKETTRVTWSTWEELLLASAVHRHGTSSWDSVAGELQKRSPSLHLVTHQICQHKFNDLKRRFTPQNDHTTSITHHLKQLRVAELKRDVQRYDLSILSLQLKVKRLEQERLDEDDSDLEKLSPVDVAGKHVSVETSEHDDESNLRDPKPEEEGEPDRSGVSAKMAGEGSCNGSSDSLTVREAEKIEPVRESEESKENSDMQSSVKSRPENDDLSPAVKCKSVESQPLVDFLEIIRSHRAGSFFLRLALESQETTKYRSVIRQPIDLETIGIRLQQGSYADHNIKFFRDMLLLSNNALVIYGSNSTESKAAIEIRQLVSKEMALKKPPLKLESVSQELISVHPIKNPDPDPEPSDSLFAKQKITVPLMSCRKRSLIPAKLSANSSEKKKEKEKQVINSKQREKSLVDVVEDDDGITKIKTRERITPNPKSSTKNSKGGALYNTNINKNLETNLNDKKNNKVPSSADNATKRGGAANFLNRMKKGSSSSNNGSFSETVKNTASHSNSNRRGTESKKNDIVVRRDQRSNGKKVKEQESPLKKNLGRPTKRTIAPPLPVSVKRSREGEDVSSSSRQARKRLRK